MIKVIYDKEFLIEELQRFYRENGRVPTTSEMNNKNGYPSYLTYINHFGSWNNALEIAGLKINKIQPKLDGTETCSYCGCLKIEGQGWYYYNDKPYCMKHGAGGLRDYVKGELDINTPSGLGRAGEILVIKTLGIGNEHDCNRISCGYSFDMYHKDYSRIDVKTSLLSDVSNRWYFNFPDKLEIKTFICIGLSLNRKIVEHVWVVPNERKIKNSQTFAICNGKLSLFNHEHGEVLNKPYNDVWQEMIVNYQNGGCKIFK